MFITIRSIDCSLQKRKLPPFWILTPRHCCQTLACVGTQRHCVGTQGHCVGTQGQRWRRCRSFRPEVAAHSRHSSLTLHLTLSTLDLLQLAQNTNTSPLHLLLMHLPMISRHCCNHVMLASSSFSLWALWYFFYAVKQLWQAENNHFFLFLVAS